MIKYLFTLVLLFAFPLLVYAQEFPERNPTQLDELSPEATHSPSIQTSEHKRAGYVAKFGITLLHTDSAESSTSLRIYTVHGHRFNPQFFAGIGLGYTPYNDPLALIPFFTELNYRFTDQNISPFLALRTGYNFSIQNDSNTMMDDHNGGLLFNPAAGIEFNFSGGTGFYIHTGYNIDNSSYENTLGNQTAVNDLSFRRLSLGLGMVF